MNSCSNNNNKICNNICNNSCNNNNENEYFSKLFYKVIHNKYIFKIIIEHLKLFVQNYSTRYLLIEPLEIFEVQQTLPSNTIKLYRNYKFKEYLYSVKFNIFNVNKELVLDKLKLLPPNIECIEFDGKSFDEKLPCNFLMDPSSSSCSCSGSKNSINSSGGYGGGCICGNSNINSQVRFKSFKFNQSYNQPISHYQFNGLQFLDLGFSFNRPIGVGVLPSSLKTLIFSSHFNQELQVGAIPSSCTKIVFGSHFNQELQIGVLPSSCRKLIFGADFNNNSQNLQPGVLSRNLEYLRFGSNFNRVIEENILPDSLVYLKFGYSYNQSFSSCHCLPNSLKTLKFNKSFNQHITVRGISILPNNLSKLVLNGFKKSVVTHKDSSIPNYFLNKLVVVEHSLNISSISQSITNLSISKSLKVKYSSIPPSVTTLKSYDIKCLKKLPLNNNIRKFKYLNPVQDPFDHYNSLVYGSSISDQFYTSLTELDFSKCKNFYIHFDFTVFKHLKSLKIRLSSIQNFPNTLENLEIILKTEPFERTNLSTLSNLKSLKIGYYYCEKFINNNNYNINNSSNNDNSINSNNNNNRNYNYNDNDNDKPVLPSSITLLELGKNFTQVISTDWLPSSIKTLIINNQNPIRMPLPSTLTQIITTPLNQYHENKLLIDNIIIIDQLSINKIYNKLLKNKSIK